MSTPMLSIILPVKNEAERLPLTLVDIDKRLDVLGLPAEVVVVSYGSTDPTPEIVKKLSQALKNLKLVVSDEDKGVGFAIRQGMLLSQGQFRLLTHVSNPVPIDAFTHLKPHLENGADLVIGSRIPPPNLPFLLKFSRGRIRTSLTNFLLRTLFFRGFRDPTSPFIAFRAETAEKIFNLTKYHRLKNLLEPLYIAKKSGFSIKESDVVTNDASIV